MVYVTNCNILHSIGLDSTSVLFEITQELRSVNESDEELTNQMVSEDLVEVRNECHCIAQRCFVDAQDKELAEASNEMVMNNTNPSKTNAIH